MSRALPISVIKLIQTELQKQGLYSGRIDGLRTVPGGRRSNTDIGVQEALRRRESQLTLRPNERSFLEWTDKRRAIGYFQLLMRDNGFDAGLADGLWGSRTEGAYLGWSKKLDPIIDRGRRFVPGLTLPNPYNFPLDDDNSLRAHFGRACWPDERMAGYRTKLIDIPFDARTAWDLNTRVTRFQWHERYAHIMEQVMHELDAAFPSTQDKKDVGLYYWGGTRMCRKITGGSRASTHAYSIAWDIDPLRNPLKATFEQSHISHPEFYELHRIMDKHGIMGLGRFRNYDSMHFQMARRPGIPGG